MNIDTSTYYPEPLLPPEEGEDKGKREERDPISGAVLSATANQEKEENLDDILEEIEEKADYDSKDPRSVGPVDMLSTLLSWILVPLLMPVYGMLLLFDLTLLSYAPSASKWGFTLIVFLINCVVPMLLVLLLKRVGLVQDYGLNGRKERLIPYIITVAAMGFTAWYMWIKGAPLWIAMFFAGGGVAALINLFVNLRWKISAHAAGIAGVVAMLVHVAHIGFRPDNAPLTWLIVWTILAGLLGTARVWLGKHTVWQVMAGYAVGFCSVYFLITFL